MIGVISEGIPSLIWFMMGIQSMFQDPALAAIAFIMAIAEVFFAIGILTEVEGALRAAIIERGTSASVFTWTFFVSGEFMYMITMTVNLAGIIGLVLCYVYQGRMTELLEDLLRF